MSAQQPITDLQDFIVAADEFQREVAKFEQMKKSLYATLAQYDGINEAETQREKFAVAHKVLKPASEQFAAVAAQAQKLSVLSGQLDAFIEKCLK